jgi:hypothetical protein
MRRSITSSEFSPQIESELVGFDLASGECLVAIARLPQLNGQALAFFPR